MSKVLADKVAISLNNKITASKDFYNNRDSKGVPIGYVKVEDLEPGLNPIELELLKLKKAVQELQATVEALQLALDTIHKSIPNSLTSIGVSTAAAGALGAAAYSSSTGAVVTKAMTDAKDNIKLSKASATGFLRS